MACVWVAWRVCVCVARARVCGACAYGLVVGDGTVEGESAPAAAWSGSLHSTPSAVAAHASNRYTRCPPPMPPRPSQ
eukprot:scaffold6790_cov69-Phaeocystis_antarctica.AAC.6